MKVAIYARVSKDESSNDERFQNPENQLVPLREFARERGHTVIKEYVDRASGADTTRPEYNQLFSDARQRKFQAILVWKLDRLSREPMSVVVGRIGELKRIGIGIISYTESWLDTRQDNPMSELVLAVMAWAASEERRKISERTKAGIRRLKAIGQWTGGRPFKPKGGGGDGFVKPPAQ